MAIIIATWRFLALDLQNCMSHDWGIPGGMVVNHGFVVVWCWQFATPVLVGWFNAFRFASEIWGPIDGYASTLTAMASTYFLDFACAWYSPCNLQRGISSETRALEHCQTFWCYRFRFSNWGGTSCLEHPTEHQLSHVFSIVLLLCLSPYHLI